MNNFMIITINTFFLLTLRAASEAQILHHISHENIVKFHGVTTKLNEGEKFYGIIMEKCEENLEGFIKSSKAKKLMIPWTLRSNLFVEIVNALVYLHKGNSKRTFIHGDLKPQNILLAKGLQVKLADFGSTEIKKAAGIATMSIDFQQTKQYSPFYTAPEYLNDFSMDKTPAMDIYRYDSAYTNLSYSMISVKISVNAIFHFYGKLMQGCSNKINSV